MHRKSPKIHLHWMLCVAGLTLAGSSVDAVPAAELKENYQSIIERNPFGLKPPPPPPTNNIAPPEAKPKVEVFLTGITSIGYPKFPKQAFFYTREQGKKDLSYYALTENSGKDGIQVLNIDAEKRKVKIKMDNAETILSFDTHGVPIQSQPAGRPLPGVPGAPALPVPGQAGGYPGAQPAPMPGAAPGAVNYDANGQPQYGTPQTMPQPLNTTMNQGSTGLRQIPSRRIRGGSQYSSTPQVPGGPGGIGEGGPGMQQPQGDPAEEYVRAHLNAAAQQQQQQSSGRRNIPVPPLPTME